jgi:hypothetical protein
MGNSATSSNGIVEQQTKTGNVNYWKHPVIMSMPTLNSTIEENTCDAELAVTRHFHAVTVHYWTLSCRNFCYSAFPAIGKPRYLTFPVLDVPASPFYEYNPSLIQ